MFCETYFPGVFFFAWSDDHLRVIARLERAIRRGGLMALAMPRGSGKSALCRTAALWAILIGARRYVVIIGATTEKGHDELAKIQTTVETNDDLQADWPEVFYPIARLERITQRQRGQTFQGQHTRIAWLANKIVFPTIPGSRASGSIITAAGLDAAIKGQAHATPQGTLLRPDLALLDDPQTTESAMSVLQSRRRERLVAADVLGMAGPGQKISAFMACTVVRREDMADNMLDREKHPDWQGERTKMVYAFPTSGKLWDEYARLRVEELKAGGDGRQATAFYAERREIMDAGARVAWAARHNEDELSALQHAMNLKIRDEAAFLAEYQNDPAPEIEDDEIDADSVAGRITGRARGDVPTACQYVTMFVDIHDKVLFWLAAAWEPGFAGQVIDYGTVPGQKAHYFTLRDARRTLGRAHPGAGREGAILAGLTGFLAERLATPYTRDDGATMPIARCLVDSGYVPEVVAAAIRQVGRGVGLWPSKGVGITAANRPFSEYKRAPGDQLGAYWRIPSTRGTRELRTVHIDVNYWKTFLLARLATPMGDKAALSLFGNKAADHRLLAEHLTAEYRVRTHGRGRQVDEWRVRPGSPDNHWLDCLVGCAVAASMCGCELLAQARRTVTGPRTTREATYF